MQALLSRASFRRLYQWFFRHPGMLFYSTLSSFETCPKKYYYDFVAKRPRDLNVKTLLGTMIHRTLELAVKRHSGAHNLLKLKQIYEEVVDAYPYNISREFADRDEAWNLLSNYIIIDSGREGDILFAERSLKTELGSYTVAGKLDRIDRLNEKLLIIDYKTGPEMEPGHDLQSGIYMFLARQTYQHTPISFAYYFLRTGRVRKFGLRDDTLRRTRDRILRIAREMEISRFRPKQGLHCAWCDHQEVCPAWKGEKRGIYRNAMDNSNAVGLSFSKASTYENCPRVYEKLYLEKIPPAPRSFFSVGRSVHNTLEKFHGLKAGLEGPGIKTLLMILDEEWYSEGFPPDEEESARQNVRKWLSDYHDRFVKGRYQKAYMLEPYFELPLGGGSDHALVGYIDRVDKNEDGTVSVIDYKTDPKVRSEDEVKFDRQLNLYAWALRTKWKLPVRDISLLFVAKNEIVTVKTDEKREERILSGLIRTANEITAREAEWLTGKKGPGLFPPTINKYCGSCDFLADCPKKPQIEMRSRELVHPDLPAPADSEAGEEENVEGLQHL